jgi:hypothetical protein
MKNWSLKLFITALMFFISWLFGHGLIQGFWETTSLECRPQGATLQIICNIHQEIYPGQAKDTDIAKAQLAKVIVIDDSRNRTIRQSGLNRPKRVVLVTTSGQEIPLTRSFGGSANEQLSQYMDEIDYFINNDQQNRLSIKTSRDFLLWAIGGFILIVDFIFLAVFWSYDGKW